MAEWFQQQASSGSLVLAVPVALIAGLVSFFTPCVIPLLPGYMSYATGLSGADLASGAAEKRGRMLLGSVLFVLGVPFIVAGLAYRRTLAAFGFVRRHQVLVSRIGGLMLVAVGLLVVSGRWDQAVTWIQIHLVSSTEASL